ncbi:unnamed protein product [Calypogeia fissa]
MGSSLGAFSSAPRRILGALVALSLICSAAANGPMGICYGTDGDNLPTPAQAVALIQSLQVTRVRIFDANPAVIQAFADSGIDVSITIDNNDLTGIALSQNTSDAWVAANVLPYVPATNISGISVGSEVIFSDANISAFLVPAMENVYISLRKNNLASTIQVTTSNAMNVLSVSYPPSSGAFEPTIATSVIVPLLEFLAQTRGPFLLNSYPYYAYVADPNGIQLAYALFSPNNGIVDSNNQLQYTNLLDAQLDAVYTAMKGLNFTDIPIEIAETGWPSRGDASETAASIVNAKTYNQNLINHIGNSPGTPLQPGVTFQTYIFSLYNEDDKLGPSSERNFGIYNADGTAVYALNFQGVSSPSQQLNRTWCIATNVATNASLGLALNFACGAAHVDCSAIQPGGSCYTPNTYQNHASYAFNQYYQASNMDPRACNFSGTATLTTRDPSYGTCTFFARSPSSGLILWHQLNPVTQFSFTILLSLFLLLKLRD